MDPSRILLSIQVINLHPIIGSHCRAECQQEACNFHVDDTRNSFKQEGLLFSLLVQLRCNVLWVSDCNTKDV